MKNLIEALNIFLLHGNVSYPTHCEHDVMYVCGYNRNEFTDEEMARLEDLGFLYNDSEDTFYSFKYGSC